MNAFIPQNPHLNLLVAGDGTVEQAATNIDPEMKVNVFQTRADFNKANAGVPFRTLEVQHNPEVK